MAANAYRSVLGPLLAARDAELRLRERQLAALVAEGYFLVRAP